MYSFIRSLSPSALISVHLRFKNLPFGLKNLPQMRKGRGGPRPLELFLFAPCALRFVLEARRDQRISPARPSALWMTDGASIEPTERSRSISG